MVIWGAFWGAVIGLLLPVPDFLGLAGGVIVGMVAGWTLRRAVTLEVAEQLERLAAANAPASDPVAGAEPTATEPFVAPAAVKAQVAASQVANSQVPEAQVPDSQVPDLVTPARPRTVELSYEPLYTAPAVAHEMEAPWLGRGRAAAHEWLLGGNTIVRLGLLVLFVGLALLARYAAEHSLLPPELRLAGIGATGIALFVFGATLQRRHPERGAYALALQGGGVAVLYLTVFAAFRLYQLFPAGIAFGLLTVICALSTFIALRQDALSMAFIGFAGAFAAPLLASDAQGNHVALFGYYLLLGVAIAVIAWVRAWRALNLLGFFATFGVATVWGVLSYRSEQYNSTQPFLLAFFLVYVVASLLYATRHSLAPRQAVDATLIFGTPMAAMGLQVALVRPFEYAAGLSALALAAFYLGLAAWALRGLSQQPSVRRWLGECFVALGIGFVTLAAPLAIDARWTSAIWAAEGAAVYWMGRRQERWLARAVGLALQLFGGMSYLASVGQPVQAQWPLLHADFIGGILLSASAFALCHWARDASAPEDASQLHQQFAIWERLIAPVLFWAGFLWLQFAFGQEFRRVRIDAQGQLGPAIEVAMRAKLQMLVWLVSAFAVSRFALVGGTRSWPMAATPAWFTVPVMTLAAIGGVLTPDAHGFEHGGWLIWPVAVVLQVTLLRRLDRGVPVALWSWLHSGFVWMLVLLIGNGLVWLVWREGLQHTAWASVILLIAATVPLLLLTRRSLYLPDSMARTRWPLDRFADAYLWRASAPLAMGTMLGSVLVALLSDGNARPLPYLPLLNPTDLSIALALAASMLWFMRIRDSGLANVGWVHHRAVPALLVVPTFIAINSVWVRIVHQFAGVPWATRPLFDSFLVQGGYSILWTLMALGAMVTAHRQGARSVWMGGAILLGITVVKLFVIDLSNRAGVERFIVFIAVGALMLVVGYLAPLPPRQTRPSGASEGSAEGAA